MEQKTPQFIYLDGDAERKQLVESICRVRSEVITLVERMPEKQWYTPRYHGWTPAAMLGHLNLTDNIHLFILKATLAGFPIRISSRLMHRINNFTTRLFSRRLVSASIRSAQNNEDVIVDFIMTLPMDQFTRKVWYPVENKKIMIERAVQVFFLYHWQQHLDEMKQVEENPQKQSSDRRDTKR